MRIPQMQIKRYWPGYIVEDVLRQLAGLVPKNEPVTFELENTPSIKLHFTCPQHYTEEDVRQLENESSKQKN